MPPSALSPIKQSYSASTCTLEVTLQPSALSQWYPKPIIDQVEFKLWIQNSAGSKPALIAQGDRATLQAIARHIEHRTQTTLTLSAVSKSAPPLLPASTHLPQPLSYLQLCDLSSVFTQYEQATAPLATSLSPAAEVDQTIALAEPSPEEITRPQSQPTPKRKIIPFPNRRRAAWASSAAAALFAIGLTATLWNRTSIPETASIADAELAEPEATGSGNSGLRLNRPGDRTATLPRNSGTSREQLSVPAPNSGATPVPVPVPVPQTSQPSPSVNNPPAGNSSPSANTPTSPTQTDTSIQPSAPADNSSQKPTVQEPSVAVPELESLESSPNNDAQTEAPSIASADVEAATPTDESPNSASSEADLPEPAAAPPQAIARSSEANSAQLRRRAAIQQQAPSPEEIAQQESETIEQVQNYFLTQWSADEGTSAPLTYQLQLSSFGEVTDFSALEEAGQTYRDRLLPDSDILFPPSNSAALPEGLTLKITVNSDGQVSVEKN